MKDQFVTYEIALKLKELGFNEFCFTIYSNNEFKFKHTSIEMMFLQNVDLNKNSCTAPLWQQAIKWLDNTFDIFIQEQIRGESDDFDGFENIESAMLEAINIINKGKQLLNNL